MTLKLLIKISKTLLFARFRQSLIAAIGVMFSITMFIVLMSFMTGLNDLLDGLILSRTPHILLYNEIEATEDQPIARAIPYKDFKNVIRSIKPKDTRQEIHNSLAIIENLKINDQVNDVAPRVTAQVFYNAGTININGIVYGIDMVAESQLFQFQDYVIEGDAKQLETVSNSIVLGKGVAEKLLVNIGEMVRITTPEGAQTPMKVVGIYQSGIAELDDVQSYASLANTQKILRKPNSYITDIQIQLHDIRQAPELAQRFSKLYNIDAIDVQTANAQFETGTTIRNIITYAVSITLLVVSGFGIYNILNMMIYEKMDSIAILKATGFSGKDVKKIFLTLSLIIGVTGGITGLIFGLLGSIGIDQIPFETESLPTVSTYPIIYNPLYYLIGIVFSVATTYIAGLFPANKAKKIDPVEIIRGK
jgi:lipoprotein-releasing system permease protein